MKDLVQEFNKRGHKISIITTKGDALNYMNEVEKHFIHSPKGYYSYGLFGVLFALTFIVQAFFLYLYLFLRGKRYDVLSIHFSLEAFLARFLKLVFGVPYVMVLAGDTPLELMEGKRADGAIQISEFMNEQSKKYGYSARVIPKGFDLERFRPDLPIEEIKNKHKIKDHDKTLLAVCRMDPRKNLATLLKALDIIVNKKGHREYKLILVGDGIERRMLKEIVADLELEENVTFVGSVPNSSPLLPRYYALADLFILPTLYEGFGWVYLEAMASGTPILTTNVGSNPEIVGGVGELIEPKDPELLANCIQDLMNDPAQLEKMRKKGIDRSRSYSWEALIPKYEKFYSEVSEKKCHSLRCKFGIIHDLIFDLAFIISNIVRSSFKNIFTFGGNSEWKSDQVGSA